MGEQTKTLSENQQRAEFFPQFLYIFSYWFPIMALK